MIHYNIQPEIGRLGIGGSFENKKFIISLSIALFIASFIDTGLQIGFNFFSPFLLVDDLAILTIAFILIFFTLKVKSVIRNWLVVLILFVCIVGVALRFYGMIQFKSLTMFSIVFFLGFVRTLILLLCLLISCGLWK